MKKLTLSAVSASVLAAAVLAAAPAQAKLAVVATTTDLASIASMVGGDRVSVEALSKGYQDPHFVDAKPSLLLKLKQADLLIEAGLELEIGWMPPLLTNAHNSDILPGRPGFLDASAGCDILQKPSGAIDRSQGTDIHAQGNPHYWLDPKNGVRIAENIAGKLTELDPQGAEAYKSGFEAFKKKLEAKDAQWRKEMEAVKGMPVITYHNSWPNFATHFGIQVVDYIEPKPGIPPSPAHVQHLIDRIKRESIKLILVEPYFDLKMPEKIARESGAQALVFPPSVGAGGAKDYVDLFDKQIAMLLKAAGKGE